MEEDWHGLKNNDIEILAKFFKPFNRDWAPLTAPENAIPTHVVKYVKSKRINIKIMLQNLLICI